MAQALSLARRGEGLVEPNPQVGCVIVRDGSVVGEGWHQRFGGPHAEVEALAAAGARARGATLYVTLEPCRHHGKTPPCTQAIVAAGIARVVAACEDPFPQVRGGGIAELLAAGVACVTGLLEAEAQELLAPYLKRIHTGRPWVIAKWAMTLDGRIATSTGDSRWISGEGARRVVHQHRGRVDAVLVGRTTAERDDPELTARPPGPRIATRVVVGVPKTCPRLLETVSKAPVLIVARSEAEAQAGESMRRSGAEVLPILGATSRAAILDRLLMELGRRGMTNVLVEGGGGLLGSLLDARQIDEAIAFVAPTLIGGEKAVSPFAGLGAATIAETVRIDRPTYEVLGSDLCVRGRLTYPE